MNVKTWVERQFTEVFKDVTSKAHKIDQSRFQLAGAYPIIDQGKEFIAGYVDDSSLVWKHTLPVIIFGDHTREIKYIDFPFVLGADGTKVLKHDESIDPKFAYYALHNINILSAGYSRHFKFLKESSIRFPSAPQEQKRVAAILEKADRLRRLRRYAHELSDTYLQSVFLDMFGDPVVNPKGWDRLKAKEIFEIRLGKMLSEKKYTGKYLHPYLRNVNVQWGYTDLTDIKEMDFDEREYAKYELKKGDILVCEGGEVGRTAIYQGEIKGCCYQNALHRLRIKKDVINREYFVQFMKAAAVFGLILKYTSQVTIAHFTAEKLEDFDILIPPLLLQNKFSQIIRKFERLQSQEREAERQAEHLFQTLLHRAFRGELS